MLHSLEDIQAALLKPAPNQGKMQYATKHTSDLFYFINRHKLNWDRIHFRCVDEDSINEIEFDFSVPGVIRSLPTVNCHDIIERRSYD